MEKYIPYDEINKQISQLAQHIVKTCCEKGYRISTAESCTGGMISAAITAVSGSSSVIELGVCSYSNRIKQQILGVSKATIDTHTEDSIECAEEMAQGVMLLAGADFGVSTTGVAGPTGGTDEHPVGHAVFESVAILVPAVPLLTAAAAAHSGESVTAFLADGQLSDFLQILGDHA